MTHSLKIESVTPAITDAKIDLMAPLRATIAYDPEWTDAITRALTTGEGAGRLRRDEHPRLITEFSVSQPNFKVLFYERDTEEARNIDHPIIRIEAEDPALLDRILQKLEKAGFNFSKEEGAIPGRNALKKKAEALQRLVDQLMGFGFYERYPD